MGFQGLGEKKGRENFIADEVPLSEPKGKQIVPLDQEEGGRGQHDHQAEPHVPLHDTVHLGKILALPEMADEDPGRDADGGRDNGDIMDEHKGGTVRGHGGDLLHGGNQNLIRVKNQRGAE